MVRNFPRSTMPTTLKVWSFHKSISREAKEDLLRHFGALSVRHVGRRGKDEALLASFKSDGDCRYALGKLHQQEVLGVRLKAVFQDSAPPLPAQEPHRCQENVEPDEGAQEEKMQQKLKEFEVSLCSIASSLGINHPIPPNLRYVYPPPSASVIANIAGAHEVPK
ncbi:RNA-binding region-containing protein 3-like [Eriocheir sinensis]|uniref:RNA-binding region-containing protein 3-like n=1 Tax=Eriocheir sinensis TaxID=95602 RepID=UPI0021CA0033|nr:RNA-binding region-containing protein 3-like [Eriocheir sinensis]